MTTADALGHVCDYCGLPLPARPAQAPRSGPVYCCFGCRFAASVAAEGGEEGQMRWTLARLGTGIFFTMNVMVFSMALWAQDVYGEPATETADVFFALLRWASLLFAAPVMLLLGGPLWDSAVASVRQRILSTDLLLVLGVLAAFAFSVRSVLAGGGHVYFEVACVVLVAVTLGRWLEATGRLKTTEALRSLDKLLPATVRRVARPDPFPVRAPADELAENSRGPAEMNWSAAVPAVAETIVPLGEVAVGETLRVLPGERIPVDGVIRRNHAAIDEQIVTGESQPAIKEPGDAVLAGTLNLDGDLLIQVTADPRRGTLQRLVDAVCQAALARSRLQRTADRVSRVFLPCVIVIALLTCGVHAWQGELEQGVLTGLSVLLIACPCALGIATPMATWIAMGRAARAGVLFRSGDAIQQLARVHAVCLDKTGTLTTGDSEVVDFVTDSTVPAARVVAAAASLAAASTHGFSRAIQRYVRDRHGLMPAALPTTLANLPGRGVSAAIEGVAGRVYLGSLRLMTEAGLVPDAELRARLETILSAGHPLACVGWGGHVRGAFVFREQLRAEAAAALRELRESQLHVVVLTGDHTPRATQLARELDIPVASELLPEEKAAEVHAIRQQHGPVAMVGDGINDAPALASSDVGIALGCGADVSRDAAQVCLLGNDLQRVPWSLRLARQTVRTIYLNLFWAFAYNVLGIAVAATGWLNPIWAAAAMVASSVLVLSNSLRLSVEPAA